MIRSILGTVGTRMMMTVMSLLVVMAAGHGLGAEGVGSVSLIVLGAAIILLVMNVVAGGGLVYLTPRYGTEQLRWPAYGWVTFIGLLGYVLLRQVPVVPQEWVMPVSIIAILQGLFNAHLGLLLGCQRIAAHNGLLVLQSVLLALLFWVLLHLDGAVVMDYVHSAYMALGAVAVISGVLSIRRRSSDEVTRTTALAPLFRQGIPAQAANALQLINYRFAYLLVERASGMAGLGLFSVTTQLAEGAWLVPKSIGMVLYTRVSNSARSREQVTLALTAVKASVATTAMAALVLILVPDTFYRWLFGAGITGLWPLLLLMTPGLLAMAASQALSHYLSGSGMVLQNALSSGIGAVVTLGLGTALIPTHGLHGAAITTSCAYIAALMHQWFVFRRITRSRAKDLLPVKGDVEALRTLVVRALGR
ncbi:MAG TPA: polysaccharide biosynthesis C-terminal domain-containing protein [Flavobacteriales bacterium]|jgi:O-antigen/teichoic acid export membrane protein|nr:polysaccharide biosynthesis C-terminal domain-containing protein [Flavobacteriales bacterium]